MGMLPVVLGHLVQAIDDVIVVYLDRQLAPVVEAAGGEVDRADDGRHAVGKEELAVELQVFEFVNLDAHVVQDPQPSDALDELFPVQGVRWTRHDVDLYAAARGADEALDDHRVLKPLVLDEERVPGVIDELTDSLASKLRTPDEV